MDEQKTLSDILSAIQVKMNVPKGQYNKFGKFHYRSAEDITEAVKDYLKIYTVFLKISDEMIAVGDRIYVKATAELCRQGESIAATGFAREPTSRKGMDESQVTGSTSSYARKYALNGLFALDDQKDPDNTNVENRYTTEQHAAPIKRVTASQVADLEALIDELGVDRHKFLKWAKAEKVEDIQAGFYASAVKALEAKRK